MVDITQKNDENGWVSTMSQDFPDKMTLGKK